MLDTLAMRRLDAFPPLLTECGIDYQHDRAGIHILRPTEHAAIGERGNTAFAIGCIGHPAT